MTFERSISKSSLAALIGKIALAGFLLIAVTALFTTIWKSSQKADAAARSSFLNPAGQSFYASPTGSPSGNGSINSPWDLETALNEASTVITPGSTLWLRGGTYVGSWNSNLQGTPSAPILVRGYTGEWPVLDGNFATTLVNAIGTTGTTITLAGGGNTIKPADVLILGALNSSSSTGLESVQVAYRVSGNTFSVTRGWNGTAPVAQSAGTVVELQPSAVITCLTTSNDVIYRDFECTDSYPLRAFNYAALAAESRFGARPEGISSYAADTQLINLVIHDCQEGIGYWDGATNSSIYGCLLFNNGMVDTTRGHGHGMYVQQETNGTKVVTNVMSMNNFAMGFDFFGTANSADNITAQQCISANNGSNEAYTGSPCVTSGNIPGVNYRECNLFLGTDSLPSMNITFNANCLYQQAANAVNFGNMALGYQAATASTNATVTNNYSAGGTSGAITMNGWQSATVTGNTFSSGGSSMALLFPSPATNPAYTWKNNTYFDNTSKKNCYNGILYAPFVWAGMYGSCDEQPDGTLDWSDWNNDGLDKVGSTYTLGKPTGTQVFINPNIYEPGRAHVAVYNWGLAATVNVNLSTTGLVDGQPFAIRSLQNFFGTPVLTGTYSKANPIVAVPMNSVAAETVATAIGQSYTPPTTCPEFAALVVMPTGANSPAVP